VKKFKIERIASYILNIKKLVTLIFVEKVLWKFIRVKIIRRKRKSTNYFMRRFMVI
jgi:hypothetical protein